ncbi:putative disease resistance protein At3g14460 [Lactuca sativa]|uniref:putative disease resistance protein At3g14460 n=1 Tax=Lactuca sativa TaxID=4236 RepID=UPI000CD8787C|nr:putative disease resistance protein At3g14460 [Lactuca sativa]
MPLGIGDLKGLQTLSKIIIGGENSFAITELKNLQNLHGKVSIWGLGNVQNEMEACGAHLSPKRLSGLELNWGYGSLQKRFDFPDWVGDPSFLGLTHVSIYGCDESMSLPRLGQRPSLKELYIGKMSKVKVVGAAVFPCLQELRIYFCPNLVEVSLATLPLLRVLTVKGCGHGVLTSLVHVASSVTKLNIHGILGLTNMLWVGVIKYLGKVEEVTTERCNEIRYLWESEAEASKVLANLRTLIVYECSNLASLGEKEEDNCGSNLTSLRFLSVYGCASLQHCSCLESLELLSIDSCDSITSVSFPTGRWQNLKSLSIYDCKKLKSMNELKYFIHLTSFRIDECPSLESFPDHELSNLASLIYLEIKKCKSMDASFHGGLWPPKLCSLTIGGLKKPMSERGPQSFPTSLFDLHLYGGPYEDVTDLSRLSGLFP